MITTELSLDTILQRTEYENLVITDLLWITFYNGRNTKTQLQRTKRTERVCVCVYYEEMFTTDETYRKGVCVFIMNKRLQRTKRTERVCVCVYHE